MPSGEFVEFLSQYGIWIFFQMGINFGLAFIGAAMAKAKGYSYGGFLCIGIFATFLVGIIVAAGLKPKPTSEYYHNKNVYKGKIINCTNCGAVCTQDMDFCPGCGSQLKYKCGSCGADCTRQMTFCTKCGACITDW